MAEKFPYSRANKMQHMAEAVEDLRLVLLDYASRKGETKLIKDLGKIEVPVFVDLIRKMCLDEGGR